MYITRVISEANDKEVTTNLISKLKQAPEAKVGRPRCFSLEEETSLIKHLRDQNAHWFADMCILSFNTGMRKGEIFSINDPEVRLENKFLFLPPHVCKNKTGRDVPFNEKAMSAYLRLKDNVGEYTEKKFANYWNKARRDIARGDKHFVFHVCRHTAASRLADKGYNQRYIADLLGHRDERTTSKYVHPNRDILKHPVDTL